MQFCTGIISPCIITFYRDICDNIIVLNRYSTLSRHVTSCFTIESTLSFKHGNTIFRSLVNCHVARVVPSQWQKFSNLLLAPEIYINTACTHISTCKKPIAHRENGIRGVASLGRCARETCAARSFKEETS